MFMRSNSGAFLNLRRETIFLRKYNYVHFLMNMGIFTNFEVVKFIGTHI
jgi:hypothetical protein